MPWPVRPDAARSLHPPPLVPTGTRGLRLPRPAPALTHLSDLGLDALAGACPVPPPVPAPWAPVSMQTLTGTTRVTSLHDTPRAAEGPGAQAASRAACSEPAVRRGLHRGCPLRGHTEGHTRPLLKTRDAPQGTHRRREHSLSAARAGPRRTRRPGPSERLEVVRPAPHVPQPELPGSAPSHVLPLVWSPLPTPCLPGARGLRSRKLSRAAEQDRTSPLTRG